jgi:hypothetical protein
MLTTYHFVPELLETHTSLNAYILLLARTRFWRCQSLSEEMEWTAYDGVIEEIRQRRLEEHLNGPVPHLLPF